MQQRGSAGNGWPPAPPAQERSKAFSQARPTQPESSYDRLASIPLMFCAV